MSTITSCDVCGEQIEDTSETATAVLPPAWWEALGFEPVADAIDVCSAECLISIGNSVLPPEPEDHSEVRRPLDEEETLPEPPRQAEFRPLHAADPRTINEALGVTERG